MFNHRLAFLAPLCLTVGGLAGTLLLTQDEERPLNSAGLRLVLTGMGYTVKDLKTQAGDDKYQFTIKRDGVDIPISADFSTSKRYIWLTVLLNDTEKAGFRMNPEKLLKNNYRIQPCQFNITDKGKLMMSLAVDNRWVTPANFKLKIDKLAKDVADTRSDWE